MLIFGDIATNKIDLTHPVQTVDIIYNDSEELAYIVNKFKLIKLNYDELYYKEYKKNDMIYRLFDVQTCIILRKLLKDSFDRKYKVTIADPFTNFVFDTTKVINYHAKFNEWESRVLSYNILVDSHIKDLFNFEPIYKKRTQKYYKLLKKFINTHKKVKTAPYKYSSSTFTEEELLTIVSTTVLNYSPLYKITLSFTNDSNESYSLKAFNLLPYQQQITACVESLYIDTLREFVIPYIKETNFQPTEEEVYRAFCKCVMYRTSQETMEWFNNFMIYNYTQIIDDFDIGFYNCFCNAVASEDISIN